MPNHSEVSNPRLALRPREAAQALGVSPKTLWTWTKNNEIPFVRHGKAVLYPVSSLNEWLASKVQKPHIEPATAI